VALEKAPQPRAHRLADQLPRAHAQEFSQRIDNLIFHP
jgi:hypothetical protein